MKTRKILTFGLLSVASVAALVSCGKKKSGASLDNLSVCLASTPDKVDPALNSAVDGATYAVHMFAGLVRYADLNNDGATFCYETIHLEAGDNTVSFETGH